MAEKHYIKDRKTEIIMGVVFFVIGSFLLYDAFEKRGKKLAWPFSAVAPW